MFRTSAICILCTAILLSGCSAGKKPEQLAQGIQQMYADADSIHLCVQIDADRNEEIMQYVLSYDYTAGEDNPTAVMTIEQPESIAGITAQITGADFRFDYEDTQLETAMPDRKGLIPADVTTYLLNDLMYAEPAQIWTEDDLIALRYEQKDEAGTILKEVYLDMQTAQLRQARIYSEGKQILQCVFTECTFNGG